MANEGLAFNKQKGDYRTNDSAMMSMTIDNDNAGSRGIADFMLNQNASQGSRFKKPMITEIERRSMHE